MGRHRVRSLMRANALRSVWRRKFVHTTDSKHAMPVSPNVLARQFDTPLPNQAWVCDITYIRTRSGWLYLAANAFERESAINNLLMCPKKLKLVRRADSR